MPANTPTPEAPEPVAHPNLVAALSAAQGAFPPIPKTKTAKTGTYSYTYADLADVLAAVRPVLSANGLALVQRTVREAGGLILSTELHHVAGEVLVSEVDLRQDAGNHQQFGGALTYLRRYEAVTLLGIQADEDTDGQHVEPAGRPAPPVEVTPPWAKLLTDADAKREALDALQSLIGDRDEARAALKATADAVGGIPHIVADLIVNTAQRRLVAEAEAAGAAALTTLNAPEDSPPPPTAGPSTIPVPEDLPQDPAKAHGTLVAAGCICPDPLAVHNDHPVHDDSCPLAGHGIPF